MKAIIPAAGLGTRLLPITKVIPKELLPVRGKPAIQWVIEEAVGAGLRKLIVVISPRKEILRDYLTQLDDHHPLVRHPGLAELERLLRAVEITFVDQPEPQGLGDALLRCRKLIGEEPFALLLPDNISPMKSRLIHRLLEVYHIYGKSCLTLRRPDDPTDRNGAFIADLWSDSVYNVRRVLPKGTIEAQGTGLRGIGRYVLEPAALSYLEQIQIDGELDEIPALDGLTRDRRLLGLLVTDEVYHLGASTDQFNEVRF